MRRRIVLALPLLGGGCGLLAERPFQEVRRFALAPTRPVTLAAASRGAVLQVRAVRPAPGLERSGLRRVGADGVVVNAPFEEWVAPPAELAEAALRRWLEAAGLFRAVVGTASRLEAALVLEADLVQLEIVPAAGEARAAIGGVLLAEPPARERVVRQFVASGTAPIAVGVIPPAPEAAASLNAALAAALEGVEREVAPAARGFVSARTAA